MSPAEEKLAEFLGNNTTCFPPHGGSALQVPERGWAAQRRGKHFCL